jgi:hypothetical protein
MEISLINGSFSKNDALHLIDQLMHVKVKFHEDKINKNQNLDDIKTREKRIIQIQNQLRACKETLFNLDGDVVINGNIKINLR